MTDRSTTDWDAVVIGAGHNGLVCAAYLARAGLRTLLLEARADVGGTAASERFGGVTVNICSCDHVTFRTTPVMDELRLERFGLRYLDVEPAQLNQLWDAGPAWPVFHDVERTLDALAQTHPGEVDGYRRYAQVAVPVARLVLAAAAEPPSAGGLVRRVLDRRGRGATTLLRWSRASGADVMRSFFTSDALRAPGMLIGPTIWGVSPEAPGTGLGALTYALRHAAQVGRPAGGSGMVPRSLLAAFTHHGGTLRTRARVVAIRCEGSTVRGVALDDGSELRSPVVVSACDPRRTFVEWLSHPPTGLEHYRAMPVPDGYESKIDAVITTLPRYRAVDPSLVERFGLDPLAPTMVVSPTLAELDRGVREMAAGRVPERPGLLANVPSVLDPSMGAPGRHVLSLEALCTPYGLDGGWPGSAEPRRWLERYADLVEPGFLDGVGEWRVMTPDVYEREFHLPRGHATSFAGGPLAALRGRDRELTRYETPVAGLYLTGAATFPGAGIWGASGRNAALTVLRRA
jgi:phytoene dehydrogenase-like protein